MLHAALDYAVREPEIRTGAPDANDEHVWSSLQSAPGCVLVTGDRALIETTIPRSAVSSPIQFVEALSKQARFI